MATVPSNQLIRRTFCSLVGRWHDTWPEQRLRNGTTRGESDARRERPCYIFVAGGADDDVCARWAADVSCDHRRNILATMPRRLTDHPTPQYHRRLSFPSRRTVSKPLHRRRLLTVLLVKHQQ